MIGVLARIPVMTLLKLLATAMVALTFMLLAMPSFAANANDGVTNQPQRPHRKHGKHHHQRQQPRDGKPSAPAPAGNQLG